MSPKLDQPFQIHAIPMCGGWALETPPDHNLFGAGSRFISKEGNKNSKRVVIKPAGGLVLLSLYKMDASLAKKKPPT